MTAIQTQVLNGGRKRTLSGTARKPAPQIRKRRILAVVDGTERTGRVLEYLVSSAIRGQSTEVIVLNVQAEPEDWRLRGYESFMRDQVRDRLLNDLGKPIVRSAGRRLERAGIPHKSRIEIGPAAQTIVRCAVEEGCSLVVLGEPAIGPIRRWLTQAAALTFNAVADRVIRLSPVPVVVAK